MGLGVRYRLFRRDAAQTAPRTCETGAGQDILTIGQGERRSDGVMICLDIGEQKPLLHANLDAIGRSRIRINANVLQLLHQRSAQP